MARGELILTLAVGAEGGRLDAGGISLRAARAGAGYTLTGSILMAPDAQVADLILCAARTSPGDPAGQPSLR